MQPKLSAKQASEALQKMRKKLAGQKREFEQNALEPLEHLARIYPLLEDMARFVELYQRQRDLADRLASLKGKDQPDEPAVKARMRDLQAEQQELREALNKLLDDIGSHAEQLPEDPRLEKLRETATEFVNAVRASGAGETMGEADAALGEFSGTRGHESARKAADILEKFISRCQGEGSIGEL